MTDNISSFPSEPSPVSIFALAKRLIFVERRHKEFRQELECLRKIKNQQAEFGDRRSQLERLVKSYRAELNGLFHLLAASRPRSLEEASVQLFYAAHLTQRHDVEDIWNEQINLLFSHALPVLERNVNLKFADFGSEDFGFSRPAATREDEAQADGLVRLLEASETNVRELRPSSAPTPLVAISDLDIAGQDPS